MSLFEIISRNTARERGLIDYFTGLPCRHGHVSARAVRDTLCRECSRIRSRNRYHTHKEEARIANRKWHEIHKECRRLSSRAWKLANPDKVKTSNLRYLKSSINYQIASTLRKRLNKVAGRRRGGSAVSHLGCSIEFFRAYLEKKFKLGMSWENRGTVWHIDHIRPLMSFDLAEEKQVSIACHYTNLQPLLVSEHNLKTMNDIRQLRNVTIP